MSEDKSTFASPHSGQDWADEQCRQILDSVDLSAERFARALEIVRADAEKRRDLIRKSPNRFDEQHGMIAERDAAVRALLETDAQRDQFDANVAHWVRIRRGEASPPAPACARPGS